MHIDHFVIMPNHVHLLVRVELPAQAAIPRAVAAIKSYAVHLAARQGLSACDLWQRGYHDRVLRDENEYRTVWEYIENNPLKWEQDRYYR